VAEFLTGKRLYYKEPKGFQWWWLIWGAAGICVFLCGVAIGVVSSGGGDWFGDVITPPFQGAERITILMVGTDNSEGLGLADTIIYAVVYPRTNEISAISIPRDSRVYIPKVGYTRINASHSNGGLPLTIDTVQNLIGIPVDKYIEVNVPGLVKLVDAIGGIDIDVEKRMYYVDHSQKLHIDLQPGYQHLDGMQAMGYVRFRHDKVGDIGRMERQQKFLHAVLSKTFSQQSLVDIPKTIDVFLKTVKTNMSTRDLMSLKRIIETSGADSIVTETLPTTSVVIGGADMLDLAPAQVQEIVNRVLLHQGLAVEVLNGTTREGMAAQVGEELKQEGCTVVKVGNASQQTDTTVIVDHGGSTLRAERVAGWLGKGVVTVSPRDNNPAEVTVIVGKDMLNTTP